MKYVLDGSVAFKWEVPETFSDKANLFRDDFRNKLHELLSPDFMPLELAWQKVADELRDKIAKALQQEQSKS